MIIYKKDSLNKIRTLEIVFNDGFLFQMSGLKGGKIVTHSKECKPKNIGKSNETNSIQQAKIEAAALIVKKLRTGYFTSEEEALSTNVIKPMLALKYQEEVKKLIKHKKIAVQGKLDGIRMVAHGGKKAMSRTNKEILTIQPILDKISKVAGDDIIFDGELYIHGKTFQEVTKLVKNPWNYEGDTIEYWIYDIIDDSLTFKERSQKIKDIFKKSTINIVIVPTQIIDNTEEAIEKAYIEYMEQGFEGMMVRVIDSMYKINGRSSDLLKYKVFIDIALPIADITPNDVNPKHGTAWVVFNGHLQKTGAKLSHVEREDLLTNKDKYIGQIGEFRYFEETDIGKMRFPGFLGIREDK